MAKAALVASHRDKTRSRSGRNPIPIRDLDPAVVPLATKTRSEEPVMRLQIRYFPVIGLKICGVEFQLFGDVRCPAIGEALPYQDRDRPGTREGLHMAASNAPVSEPGSIPTR